jgi:hypothetical protein
LWPTRRYFELRQQQLQEQLGALEAALAEIAGDCRRLAVAQEQLSQAQAQAAAADDRLLAGQAEVRTRLRRTQALSARTYEALAGWPAQLEQARVSAAYARAYEDPEPLISIPIPTYRSPETLCERALPSVLSQTYNNWEAVVVGDHCTDETEARVLALGDPRIRFHNLPVRENDPDDPWERWAVKGSIPRATGVMMATGSWIAPLSHDDAWDSHHLRTLLKAARAERAEVAYSRMRRAIEGEPETARDGSCGAWPPRLGEFNWQATLFNGALRFLRYDRNCALASEPNDWNLARRAWEAGIRFHFVDRETATLYVRRENEVLAALAAQGLPPETTAAP